MHLDSVGGYEVDTLKIKVKRHVNYKVGVFNCQNDKGRNSYICCVFNCFLIYRRGNIADRSL